MARRQQTADPNGHRFSPFVGSSGKLHETVGAKVRGWGLFLLAVGGAVLGSWLAVRDAVQDVDKRLEVHQAGQGHRGTAERIERAEDAAKAARKEQSQFRERLGRFEERQEALMSEQKQMREEQGVAHERIMRQLRRMRRH